MCAVQNAMNSTVCVDVVLERLGDRSLQYLYEHAYIDRADDKPVVNRIRCAHLCGTYKISQLWPSQCPNPSHGEIYCKQHQHEEEVHSRATAVLCTFARLATDDRHDLRILLRGDRQLATSFMASCLFVEPSAEPEPAAEPEPEPAISLPESDSSDSDQQADSAESDSSDPDYQADSAESDSAAESDIIDLTD